LQVFIIALFERAFLPPQPDDRPGDLAGHSDGCSDRSARARGPGSRAARACGQGNALTGRARRQWNASPRHITDIARGADDAAERAASHHFPLLFGAHPHVFLFALCPRDLVSPLELRVFEGGILLLRERRLDARDLVVLARVEFTEPFDLSGLDAG